jgi:nicotinamidase-related amidase
MNTGLLVPAQVCLQIVDVQASMMAKIDEVARVTARIGRMIRCASLLGVPMVANTQYRKGLGPLVPEIAALLAGVPQFDKLTFNALANRETATYFDRLPPSITTVALVGIETHICVYQTAMALLGRGLAVWVVADAVSSRYRQDHLTALARLQVAGAAVGSLEMLVFELLGQAGTATFKAVQPCILERESEPSPS